MEFDGSWTISLAPGADRLALPSAEAWPVVTNGSIAIVPALDPGTAAGEGGGGLDASRCVLGSPSGQARDFFQFCRVRVAVDSGSSGMKDLVQELDDELSLDMQRGVFSMGCRDRATGCRVRHELRALLQLPGTVLHSVFIEVPGADPATVQVTHEVRADIALLGGGGKKARYCGDSILVSSGQSQLVLSAEASGRACVSGYLAEAPLAAASGYNQSHGRSSSKAWSVLQMRKAVGEEEATTTTFAFHVLTTTGGGGSGDDCNLNVVKRRLMSVLGCAPSPAEVAALLVAGHDAAWDARWNTWVDVPTGADPSVAWALRYAFYNLHSCLRSSSNNSAAGITPPACIDLAGTTLGAAGKGDDFLGNLLVLVAPAAARAHSEERWRRLPAAVRVAESEGLAGARFPYAYEAGAYRKDADADDGKDHDYDLCCYEDGDEGTTSMTPMWRQGPIVHRVHGTLMAAVNAWNYFRATQDIDWLADRAWPVIKAAADLVCSIAASSDPSSFPQYPPAEDNIGGEDRGLLRLAVGMDLLDPSSSAGSPTVVAGAVATLRAATEASYALGYTPPQLPLWTSVRYRLALQTIQTIDYAYADAVVAAGAGGGGGPLTIPEPLLVMAEPLASLCATLGPLTTTRALPANVAYWCDPEHRTSLRPGGHGRSGRDAAVGDLVCLHALAQLAQVVPSKSEDFADALASVLAAHADMGLGGWGNLRPANGPASAPNDLGLSALLILAFVQGLGGAFVQGGYTPGQLVYASLGVNTASSAVLPAAWERMILYGIGPRVVDVVILNSTVFPGTDPSAGNDTPSSAYVPWSITL